MIAAIQNQMLEDGKTIQAAIKKILTRARSIRAAKSDLIVGGIVTSALTVLAAQAALDVDAEAGAAGLSIAERSALVRRAVLAVLDHAQIALDCARTQLLDMAAKSFGPDRR